MATFKTRARALEMLGRQQIAGIPTAVNELFKNAHDAYADRVEVDYLKHEDIVVIRDDGVGMTKGEFISRWLTIGTENKIGANKNTSNKPPLDKPIRKVMGEKGIGRLAISSIGSQVLVLTKSYKDDSGITTAFINWRFFELPGLDLDEIIIPVKTFENIPTSDEINSLKIETLNALESLIKEKVEIRKELVNLKDEIQGFYVDPVSIQSLLPSNLKLSGNKHGTHFYISPVEDSLIDDIISSEKGVATKMEKMLVGFTNSMTPGHPEPSIEIAFRNHISPNYYNDLIDKEEFFTPYDFKIADHHFAGHFDEFGQFSGKITIYNEKTYDHEISWSANNYKPTLCGPFNIELAYFQGRLKHSTISPDDYSMLRAKGDKFGGLYIYKDNIRILPYGNSDYDFLDVESNRTKSASYYFFSYRRMFGVVTISDEINYNLKEKAGREGFIENKAYRQLRSILKNFFVNLAADFFREGATGGIKSRFWVERKDEREKFYKALERRNKLAKGKKDAFIKQLETFFDNINTDTYKNKIESIVQEAIEQLDSIEYSKNENIMSRDLLDIEKNSLNQLSDLGKEIKISRPSGFAMSKDLRHDYDAYLLEYDSRVSTNINKAVERISDRVSLINQQYQLEVSKRKRLEESVQEISREAIKIAELKEKEATEVANQISLKVKELTNDLMIDLDTQIQKVNNKIKKVSVEEERDIDLVKERLSLEFEIEESKNKVTHTLERIINQLQGVYWEKDMDKIITSEDVNSAMSEELEELRDRLQVDIELSQLGLAVGVIHHEFTSTVRAIRSSLKDLKGWVDVNNDLENVYRNIKINFEHLDGYLNLFTPLDRRLHRKRETIKLIEIKNFLKDLFSSRFERHQIEFKHTKGFAKNTIYGFRSVFYPVFVNIIDNAIYWLKNSNQENSVIRLHADEDGIYVSNNGQSIKTEDRERIFDLGVSRKPNGRGMGLHISSEVLRKEGYALRVVDPRQKSTVTFKIFKRETDE